MQKKILENCLTQVVKELKDCLFLFMIIQQVIINFLLILSQNISPRVKIENYNIEIDGRNFYDQPINESIKQYDEVRKASTGQGDDYTTGCLLDFTYFEKKLHFNCRWFKQTKRFRCWFKSNSKNYFTGKTKSTVANTRVIIYYILEQSKEKILQFSKGTTKVW